MSGQQGQGSSTGSNSVDYTGVDLPDKSRTEWHYTHRRAELLQLIKEAGHPDELNQTELAERYDVSQQQISKDIKRIGGSIRESVDMDRRAVTVDAVLQRSIRGLLDDERYYKAGQLALEWDEWIDEAGISTGEDSDSGVTINLSEEVHETFPD